MKLVQLLAKELKEWPEGISCIIQDGSGKICTCRNGFPDPYDGDWTVCGPKSICTPVYWANIGSNKHELAIDQASAIITKEQWQAEREKMNKPKWIRHRGGWMPVGAATIVEVRLRCGDIQKHEACEFLWRHKDCDSAANIMAYRVIEETKDQEIEEVETIDTAKAPTIEYAFGDKYSDPNDLDWKQLGTLTYKLEIDATEATKEIDSLVAKWGQLESPLKWRDEIIELEAYEEEFRREREKLIRKLESEGFKLIDHMAPVYGDQIIDFSDWRNWQAGDIVECVTYDYTGVYTNGKQYVVEWVNDDGFSVFDDCGKGSSCDWFDYESEGLKFIRRP